MTPFKDWIREKVKQNKLIEGEDYEVFLAAQKNAAGDTKGCRGGNNKKEYILTLDASKMLAMQAKSDIGIAVRRYFVLCEKLLKGMAVYNPPRILSKANQKKVGDWYQDQLKAGAKEQPMHIFKIRFNKLFTSVKSRRLLFAPIWAKIK